MLMFLARVIAATGLIFAVWIIYYHFWDLLGIFADDGDKPVQPGQLEQWQAVAFLLVAPATVIGNFVAMFYPFAKAR